MLATSVYFFVDTFAGFAASLVVGTPRLARDVVALATSERFAERWFDAAMAAFVVASDWFAVAPFATLSAVRHVAAVMPDASRFAFVSRPVDRSPAVGRSATSSARSSWSLRSVETVVDAAPPMFDSAA